MPFLLQHVDSLIQIVLGAACTWLGFGGARLGPRARKVLRVCGPALVVIGALLLVVRVAEPRSWQLHQTADGVASAELPGASTPQESVDTLGAVTVKRTSLTYNVPGKDLSLFFSQSALPEQARAMSDAQRLEATLEHFASQGFSVSHRAQSGAIHRLALRHAGKKATVEMALAYVGDQAYRVVASYTDGSEDRALVDRFVGSFRVR